RSQGAQQGGFTGPGPTGDDDVPASTDRCGQQLVQEGVQGAQATQLPQARGAVTVAADGHGRLVGNVQDRVQPGPIGQGHVQNGSGGVKAAFPCRGVGGDATYESH